MSTSAIARGTIAERQQAEESIPENVALDAAGDPTTDPSAALEGTILPFDGAKGSGLAIAVEILAGGLVGASMGQDVTGTYRTENLCTKGDLFIAIDPTALASQGVTARISSFLQRLKQTETRAGQDNIRLPGERSVSRDRSQEQIEIPSDLWEKISQL
jgi:L-2-hydroxycarboxylate dehydrogenase (NAD+)